eukprot:ANDGO_08225.mRNA.1 Mitotic checkpoint serine/threonine-protein kinase BUB1
MASFAEIEGSKENILPLKSGRSVSALKSIPLTPLSQSHGQSQLCDGGMMSQTEAEFESILQTEDLEDPLGVWVAYISHVRQRTVSDPSKQLKPLLLRCGKELEKIQVCRHDIRLLKIWIEYADLCTDPFPVYQYLLGKEIGTEHALLYLRYAEHLEWHGQCVDAQDILSLGLECMAHPVTSLRKAFEEFKVKHPVPSNSNHAVSLRTTQAARQGQAPLMERRFGTDLDGSEGARPEHRPMFQAATSTAKVADAHRRPLTTSVFHAEPVVSKENAPVADGWNRPIGAMKPMNPASSQPQFAVFNDGQLSQQQTKVAEKTGYDPNLLRDSRSGGETCFEMHRARKYSVAPVSPMPKVASTPLYASAQRAVSTPASAIAIRPMLNMSQKSLFQESPTVCTKAAMREVMDMFSSPLLDESPVKPVAMSSVSNISQFEIFEDETISLRPSIYQTPIAAPAIGFSSTSSSSSSASSASCASGGFEVYQDFKEETMTISMRPWPEFPRLKCSADAYSQSHRQQVMALAVKIVEATSPNVHSTLTLNFDAGELLGSGEFGSVLENSRNASECAKVTHPERAALEYLCYRHLLQKGKFVRLNLDQGVLIMPRGDYSLQDVVNAYRVAGDRVDELVCMYYSLLLIREVLYLHKCGVIHNDVKPDNIIIFRGKPRQKKGAQADLKTEGNSLLLVDFGNAIPIPLYENGTRFRGCPWAEGFEIDDAEWVFEGDYYGILACIYFMLQGEYMPHEEASRKPFKRYWRRDLWRSVFGLLEKGNGEAAAETIRAELASIEDVEDALLTIGIKEKEAVDSFRRSHC